MIDSGSRLVQPTDYITRFKVMSVVQYRSYSEFRVVYTFKFNKNVFHLLMNERGGLVVTVCNELSDWPD